MSNSFFIDQESARACLGVVERAFERARRGEPVVLGQARSKCTASARKARVRHFSGNAGARSIPADQRRRIVELSLQGVRMSDIARRLGITTSRVSWVRMAEGVSSMGKRRAAA